MFRPESDWRGQNRPGVEGFAIERAFSVRGVDVDIRRFEWVSPCEVALSPAKHYLDFSLTTPSRRSLLEVDAWKGARPAGDILFLPRDFTYWGTPAIEERRLLCLAIGEDFLDDLFEGEQLFCDLLPCADIQRPTLRRTLEALAGELAMPGFATATLVESLIISLTVDLARYLHDRESAHAQAGSASERQVRRIVDYVMANLEGALGIGEIARECGISTRHVARIFKDISGVSLGEFVTRSRIALAKELLTGDTLQIKEISWRCGFRSTSAFSAAFRAATSVTPRDYREGVTRRH